MTVLVTVGTISSGRIRQTTARAPAYRASRFSRTSTSTVRKTGGKSPANSPQQPTMTATCPLLVKLSMDDIHHKQAVQPATATSTHTYRSERRWKQVLRSGVRAMPADAGASPSPAVTYG